MMCSKPFRQGIVEFGCGQCLPCRINRRRMWTARLVLEATQHQHSAFLTLTYNDENLPEGGTLVPRHLQLYLKRLRRSLTTQKLRYYAVGEYGERTFRPHYHVVLFGAPLALDHIPDMRKDCVCAICKPWIRGRVHIGDVTPDSAAYTVSYTLKKMTKVDDARLQGRHPEFARMSLRPGIGAGAVVPLSAALTSRGASAYVAQWKDVPPDVRFNGSVYPIGRYLKEKVRVGVGMVKQKYRRGEAPVDIRMLQKVYDLQQPGALDRQEARRRTSALKADYRSKLRVKGVL